jgi:alanine racemase
MRWTAPIIAIRDIPAGATVGYGQSFVASKPTRLGLIPVGYADGYPWSLGNRGVMMLHNQPAKIAGRVSMDLIILDLENIPHATLGDEVTIMDNDPLSPASVYRLAEMAGTIPYELLCRIGKRIKRIAVDDF